MPGLHPVRHQQLPARRTLSPMRVHRTTEDRMSIHLLLLIVLCAVFGGTVLWLVFELLIKWLTLD